MQIDPRTFGRLLHAPLDYKVAVSFRRQSEIFTDGNLTVSLDKLIDKEDEKDFVQVKSTDRQVTLGLLRLGV